MPPVGVKSIGLDRPEAMGIDVAISWDLSDGGASSFHFQREDRIGVAATIINAKNENLAVVKG